jgi:5-methyltetrahydrofolate--homocysteine methyltransferase
MELEFKPDFDLARENWRRFWAGTLNRPIILSVIPKDGVNPVPAPRWGAAFSEKYEDVVDQALKWAETHEFLGDSVPFFLPSLIIDSIPAFLGAEIVSIEAPWGTDSHAIPFVKDLSSTEIIFRRDSKWWEEWLRLAECVKRKCAGKMVFGSAQAGYNNLDILGAIRGKVELMTDFYDNPEGVHCALRQILKAYNEITDELCRLFEFGKNGSVTGHGFYSDGMAATPQCDFGFNIGKEHFDEFALPYLRREIARLDAVEYHLDGPGNITHVESICGIDKIGVIQWVPGAGDDLKNDWTGLYEKINGLGKGLWLGADSPKTAVDLWKKYNRSGRILLGVSAKNRDDVSRYIEAFEGIKK